MKKHIIILIFLALLIFLPGFSSAVSYDGAYCRVDLGEPFWSAWGKCEGDVVKIWGAVATDVLQHPIGLHDSVDFSTNTIKHKFETYVNIGENQIVITSDKKIECTEGILIIGEVDLVDFGSTVGKSSYHNVWIKVGNYRCKSES